MAEKRHRRRRAERQNWHPNFILRILRRVWRIAFSALKVAAGAVATVLMIGIVCCFVFATMLGQYLQDDIIPQAQINIDNLDMEKTSYVYYKDENGNYQILQQLATTMDRRWVPYEEIPQDLIHAAVAIEDKRFYEHQGVDWITTIKACANMFFGSGSQFGGSTLTQQLVKNILLMEDENANDVTVQRKILEIFRALQFEKTYDKEVVIEYYMNTVYFGSSCYGVKSAAEHYFGKELQDMNTAELAALIGITNNPSMFNPYSQKVYEFEGMERDGAGRNRYRQQVVLTQMYVQGWLSQEQYLTAYNYPLEYKVGIDDQDRWNSCKGELDAQGNVLSEGCGYSGPVRDLVAVHENPEDENSPVTYFCPDCGAKIDITVDASKGVYSWYVDTVLEDVAKELAAQDGVEWGSKTREHYMNLIGRSGYHIYTPYDANAQAAVDKIYTDMNEIPEVKNSSKLNSAIIIIDNKSGDIVAMAGDTGPKTVSDATNHATDDPKQIGSSIKPLTVYAPAFELGLITPASLMLDLPLYYMGENNTNPYPVNNDGVYRYNRTIWRGIINSYNTIAANTLELMGTKYSFNFAKDQLGLTGLRDNYVTQSGSVLSDIGIAALAMGGLTKGVTVRDVTAAYATFANGGVYREARTFTLILDDQGKVVLKNEQESRRVLSEKAVDYMNYCLDGVVSSGTGTSADMYKEQGMDVAGKTGTTNSNKDLYFAGFTGYYTAAVWSGFKIPEKIVLSGSTVSPSTRLWKKVMLQLHQGKETIPLYNSDVMESVTICLESGKLATEACKNDIRTNGTSYQRFETIMVYPEDAPTQFCDKHITVSYCTSGNGVANDYCHKFHSVGAAVLKDKALVKFTKAKLDEIFMCNGQGLHEMFRGDEYIYLVDEAGNPVDFFGMSGNINQGLHVPYKECTVHTEASWEQYKKDHPWIDGGNEDPDPDPDPDPTPNPDPNPNPDPILPPPGPGTGTEIMGDFFDRIRGFLGGR